MGMALHQAALRVTVQLAQAVDAAPRGRPPQRLVACTFSKCSREIAHTTPLWSAMPAPSSFVLPLLGTAAVIVALSYLKRRRVGSSCKIVYATSTQACGFMSALRRLIELSFPEDVSDEDTRTAMNEDALSVLSGFHDVDQCEWLLAMHNGQLIGIAMMVAYHDSLYVSSLCVLPTHRGRGVGSKLMRSASAHVLRK